MPIQVLPEHLVNQIAAGEVIVRPASAVKELVENSLDAGATMISVHVAQGCRELRVTDDGCGMGPEDAGLALIRHATSKISQFEDLYRLTTRGFRGEALASIAAVSRVRLLTRRAEDLAGTLVTSEGGSPPEVRPAGAPTGTDIHIRDLFFNTPARLKFLKAAAPETTAVLQILTRLAVARPEIGFRVSGESGVYFELPRKQAWRDRIATLLGIPDQASQLLPVDFERHGVTLRGYIAPPSLSGRDRRRQHFLLDGRPISSRTLAMVLQEAYRGVLMVGRFPWVVLDIVVPEGEVDINVHPSKEEVRFRRESVVTSAVYRGVQEALRLAHIVPEATVEALGPAPDGTQHPSPTSTPPGPTTNYQPEMLSWKDWGQTPSAPRPPGIRSPVGSAPAPLDLSGLVTARGPEFGGSQSDRPPAAQTPESPNPWRMEPPGSGDTAEGHPTTDGHPTESSRSPDQSPSAAEAWPTSPAWTPDDPPPASAPTTPTAWDGPPPDAQEDGVLRWLRESGMPPEPLGQVADCYIVARVGETLLLIDQHAAHERIMYARLSAATAPMASQPLLIPLTVDVPPEIVPALNRVLPLLAWFGFEASHFGGQTFVVQSTPGDLMPRLDPLALLQDLLSDLADPETRTRPNELEQLRDRIITRMSCRSAIKAGQTLHPEEMAALLRDLATTPLGTNCPHGRPTMVTLTRHSLDKLFKRIV